MARFRYDVNTQTKLLDIHKQFQGGLKTVDTDDSLKTIFLRQAENLELSEYGFLEKRYGQVVEKQLLSSGLTASSNLQGYFEYTRSDKTIDKILIIDGKLFLSINGASFTQITKIKSESGKRYPSTLIFNDLGMDIDDDFITIANDAIPFGGQVYTTASALPGSQSQTMTAWVLDTNSVYTYDTVSNTWGSQATVTFDMDLLKVHDTANNRNYYYKSNTNAIYKYVQNSSTYYQLVAESSPDYADADFQRTRPIEAARLKDTLYIFTGTYPITYRGDGNFYLLDIYTPNDVQVEIQSHNYLENDFEDAYKFSRTVTVNNNTVITGDDLLTYTESTASAPTFDYKPDLPYNTGTGSGFEAKISYNYKQTPGLNNYGLQQGEFDEFLSGTHDEVSVGDNHIPDRSVLVELYPVVYTRPAGGGGAWEELDKSFYNPESRSNTDASSNFEIGAAYEATAVFQKDYTQAANRVSITQSTPISVNITKLPLGTIDLKIELIYSRSGYTKLNGGSSSAAFYGFEQVKEILFEDIYSNLLVSEEKIQDFGEDNFPKYNNYPDIWSANRVLVHYGKLLVYGSQNAGQNIYVSHPDYPGNYFPGNFALEYNTEERDAITKVAPFQNILVVMTEDYMWGVKGVDAEETSANPYRRFTISPLYGTIAPDSVRPVRNYLMFLSKEGIMQLTSLYAVDEQYNVKPADENIRNIVPRVEDDKHDPTKAVAIQFEDQYWIHFPDKLATNQNNMVLRYYADTKSWMKDTYFTKQAASAIIFKGLHKWIRRTGQGLAYISLPYYDGTSYRIDEITLDYNMPSDLGYSIQAILETANLEQGYPFHPKQYKEAKLEFALQNEFNASVDPLFPVVDSENQKSHFDTISSFKLYKNHKYRFDFGRQLSALFTVTIDSVTYNMTLNTPTPEAGAQQNYYYEFTYTGDTGDYDIVINEGSSGIVSTDVLALSNITYDDKINYYVWLISDDNTLNFDNLSSYDASKALNAENLGTRNGTWTFGETDFGNRVAAVQTIRLAGKGKNIKLYLEEISKSKWTLESLGFMYKLRRARGNR
jgi:hypothetical protein